MKMILAVLAAILGLVILHFNYTHPVGFALLIPLLAMVCTWADGRRV